MIARLRALFPAAPVLLCLATTTMLRGGESIGAGCQPHGLFLAATRPGDGPGIVAVGELGTIVRSVDGGHSWTPCTTPPATATLTSVAFGDKDHGWAVGHDATILSTSDGGGTWTLCYQGRNLEDSFLAVLAIDARHVLAIGAYGLAMRTVDGGEVWERFAPQEGDRHLNAIARDPATHTLYIAGEEGTLLKSDDGATWRTLPAPYDGSFHAIFVLGKDRILVTGLRGHHHLSTDGGATWTEADRDSFEATGLLCAETRLPDGRLLLAGAARTWLSSTDDGASFAPVDPAPLRTAVAQLLTLSDGSVLALGDAGVMPIAAPTQASSTVQ